MRTILWRERWIPVLVGVAGLGLVGALAWRELASAGERQDLSIARIAQARLDGARRDIGDWTQALQDTLAGELEGADDARLDSLAHDHPLALAAFRTVRGEVVFPDSGPASSREDLAFLERTRRLWSGHAVVAATGSLREGGRRAGEQPGWIPWHWEDGLHILVRIRRDDTTDLGLELDRTALLSRLVGEVTPHELGGGAVDLLDGSGRLLHRWGSYTPDTTRERRPLARGGLATPFETWSLEIRGPEAEWAAAARATTLRSVLLRWGIAGLAWIVAVFLVSREWTRTLREARLKTGFVQQVSHELRTPLTNIRLHAELARDGTLEDDTFRHLEVVGQETERLSRLVSNILTFARSEAAPLRVHPVAQELGSLLESALASFAPTLARTGMVLERSLPTGECVLVVDPDAAVQILQNLVGNAVKYASGGRWIGIVVERCSNRWEIRVRDRGPGVPASRREDIFRPFVRLSDRITEGVAGTGIGLGIARDLARSHGGDLTLETADSGGCTFLWTLPRDAS